MTGHPMTADAVREELRQRGWLSPAEAAALRDVIEIERAEVKRLTAELARSATAMTGLIDDMHAAKQRADAATAERQPLAIIRSITQRGRTAAIVSIDGLRRSSPLYVGMPIYDGTPT